MATGGTLKAMKELIEENGSKVVGIITLIELTDLKGRDLFKDTPVVTFMKVPH
jgi:adenine phosphoribosyltransferase